MDSAHTDDLRLPIWATLGEAFMALAEEWDSLLKAIALPAMIVASANVIAEGVIGGGTGGLGLWIIPLAVIPWAAHVIIAVACHRYVLMGREGLPSSWGLFWTKRETRFLGWTLAISMIAFLFVIPGVIAGGVAVFAFAATFGEVLLGAGSVAFIPIVAGMALALVPAIYVIARLSLLLPMTAVGQRPELKDAWALSRGNGWRLVAVMLLPSLFSISLTLPGLLFPEGGLYARLSWSFLLTLVTVFGIGALSKAYSWLSHHSEVESAV